MWEVFAHESRPAGRNRKAHGFSGGSRSLTNRVPRARHKSGTETKSRAVPGGLGFPFRLPTVETVGYHLPRPRRSHCVNCPVRPHRSVLEQNQFCCAKDRARQGGIAVSPGRNRGPRQPPHLRLLGWLSPG